MSDIRETIAALLKKASSSEYENESEIFLRKASQLMERHQIDLADLPKDERKTADPMGTGTSAPYQPDTPASVKYFLLSKVARYFGCYVLLCPGGYPGQQEVHYHGPRSSRDTTELMFPFIWKQVLKLARENAEGRGEQRKLQRDLSRSLSARIARILQDREENPPAGDSRALVVVNDLRAASKEYGMSLYDIITPGKPANYKPVQDIARELAERVQIDPSIEEDEEETSALLEGETK